MCTKKRKHWRSGANLWEGAQESIIFVLSECNNSVGRIYQRGRLCNKKGEPALGRQNSQLHLRNSTLLRDAKIL
jgi:hypothetical protein